MAPVIRTALVGDLPAILELWRLADAEPGRTDNIESLAKLIAHDPDAVLVAADGREIVGAVIAAWDGCWAVVSAVARAFCHTGP